MIRGLVIIKITNHYFNAKETMTSFEIELTSVAAMLCVFVFMLVLLMKTKHKTRMFKCSLSITDAATNSNVTHTYNAMVMAECNDDAIIVATKIFLGCDIARLRYIREFWNYFADPKRVAELANLIHKENCIDGSLCSSCNELIRKTTCDEFTKYITANMVVEPYGFNKVCVEVNGRVFGSDIAK
jgi:hypothetical protein